MDWEYTYLPFHHTFLESELFTMSKYIEFKRKGKFYEVAYEDAYILWYLLRYKIHNNKVGLRVLCAQFWLRDQPLCEPHDYGGFPRHISIL